MLRQTKHRMSSLCCADEMREQWYYQTFTSTEARQMRRSSGCMSCECKATHRQCVLQGTGYRMRLVTSGSFFWSQRYNSWERGSIALNVMTAVGAQMDEQ